MGRITKAQIAKLFTLVSAVYSRFESTDVKIELWHDMIGDLDYKIVEMALKKVMMTSEFPPTIAALRKAAMEICTSKEDVLNAGKAWGEVQRAIQKWGWPEPVKALNMMSPLTQQVVKQLSWKEICMCENTGVLRGQFIKMYNSMKERKQQDKLLPEDFKQQINLISGNSKIEMLDYNGGN